MAFIKLKNNSIIQEVGPSRKFKSNKPQAPAIIGTSNARLALCKQALDTFCARWEEGSQGAPVDLTLDEYGKPELRNHITAGEMLYHYIEERHAFFKSRTFTLLAVERPFAVPIDENQPNLIYVGRLDKEFRYEGHLYIG